MEIKENVWKKINLIFPPKKYVQFSKILLIPGILTLEIKFLLSSLSKQLSNFYANCAIKSWKFKQFWDLKPNLPSCFEKKYINRTLTQQCHDTITKLPWLYWQMR